MRTYTLGYQTVVSTQVRANSLWKDYRLVFVCAKLQKVERFIDNPKIEVITNINATVIFVSRGL